ncbi:glycosyltransferase family 69 protein, partial [Peniophora sp. CONT]
MPPRLLADDPDVDLDDLSHDTRINAPMPLPWAGSRRRRRFSNGPRGCFSRFASRIHFFPVFLLAIVVLALYIVYFYVHALWWGADPVASIQRDVYKYARNRRPTCSMRPWQRERYAHVDHANRTVFIAANLYNNEDVLPTFFQELPLLLRYLGPANVYISVYENGSTDKTPHLLQLLRELLSVMGTPHRILTDPNAAVSHSQPGARIATLVGVRNTAMAPLYTGDAAIHVPNGKFDEVLFLNDIFHCASDILELFHQKRTQGANQVCATDWGDPVVYDRWVMRSITGNTFYRYDQLQDYFNKPGPDGKRIAVPPVLPYDDNDRLRFTMNLPMQVFSCWNGATIFDAEPFVTPSDPLRFRVSHADLDSDGRPKKVTDKASECFLPSVDMWRKGLGRVLLVPRASVAYWYDAYQTYRKDGLPPASPEQERVKWVDSPPAMVAMQDNAVWWEPERWAPWDEQ